jgi:succinate-semialdehyde dehydrogenase/glutarate-semialdehyde dehydrogenase
MPILPDPPRDAFAPFTGQARLTRRNVRFIVAPNTTSVAESLGECNRRDSWSVWEDAMYESLGLYIGGEWRGGRKGRQIEVIDPASERPLGSVPAADSEDVAAAIAAAETAWRPWSRVPAWERAKIMRRIGDLMRERAADFRRVVAQELGRPQRQVDGEIALAADQFEWYAEETKRLYGETIESRLAGGHVTVTREPVGVVAAFTAWNFPLVLLARKIAPALAAGCAIVCRPSEETPVSAMLLVKCCHDAGLPAGLVNLLVGPASEIAPAILASPLVRKVSLTGSIAVGKSLYRQSADTLKRLSMELGGHAPVIVCADADPAKVAELTVPVKFRNAGQVCVSPSRFFIHRSRHDAFVERFVQLTRALKIGNPMAEDSDIGPLGNRRRLEAIETIVADTKAAGARLECGGRRPPEFNAGYYYEPTVFTQVPDEARIMREEPFGPVVPITTFESVEEVIERSNASDYGLASYVFTGELATAHRISGALKAGMCGVNTYALAAAEVPFGGVRDSGFGREGGFHGLADYLETKYTHFAAL